MADNDFKQENDSEKVATVNEVKEERTVNEVQNVTTVHEKKPQTDTKVSESTKDKTDSQLTDSPQKGDEDKKEASLDRELDAPASVDPEKEKKGPFQTGDIIEYMFKEWLIAGMNWLWVETVYHHDKGYYKRKYAKEYAAAARKKEKKLENYDTYKKMMSLGDKATKNIEKDENAFSNNTTFVDMANKLRSGNFDDVSDDTAFFLKNMSRKSFDVLLDPQRVQKVQKNINNNIIAASQFSNVYARVALTEQKMSDASSPTDQKAWDKAQKEGVVLYLRLIDNARKNGKDINAYSKHLLETIDKSAEEMRKNLVDGKFDGYSKKNFFGKTKKGKYSPNKAFASLLEEAKNINRSDNPQNIYEEVVMQQNFDASAQDRMLQHNMSSDEFAEERARLAHRREALERAKANIKNNPSRLAAREKIEKMRAQKRQKRIEDLKNPDYVIKDSKGNDNRELTSAMRKYYQDRFMMR